MTNYFGTGAMPGVFYDTHRVHSRPKGNIGVQGANRDPGDSRRTNFCFGSKFKLPTVQEKSIEIGHLRFQKVISYIVLTLKWKKWG